MPSEPNSRAPIFSDNADPELAARRRTNVLAVLGLLVALAAPLAMSHSMFWSVPAVGLLLCALAVMQIQRDPDGQRGYGVAIVGLLISIVFLAAAPSYHLFRNRYVQQQARSVAERWLELILDDKLHRAYVLTLDHDIRPTPGSDLKEYFAADPSVRAKFERFRDGQFVEKMKALGESAESPNAPFIEYLGTIDSYPIKIGEEIVMTFSIRSPDASEEETEAIHIRLQRRDDPVRTDGLWQISLYRFQRPSASWRSW